MVQVREREFSLFVLTSRGRRGADNDSAISEPKLPEAHQARGLAWLGSRCLQA